MSKVKQKANYWPHGIVLSIVGVFGLCVWTVKEAMQYPVELDSFYFDSYYNVNQDINNILLKQKAFDEAYVVDIPKGDLTIGTNTISVKITEKMAGLSVDDANISLLLTRPHTRKADKKPTLVSHKEGVYTFTPFEIKDLGRWQIMTKVTVGELVSFNKLEVNATK